MKVKLPYEVETFAQDYYAAESRATKHVNGKKAFRKVDQKELARKCKHLLESGAVENLYQLSIDLASYKGEYSYNTHQLRLRKFAKRSGIVYNKAAPEPIVVIKPHAPVVAKVQFDLKSILNNNFDEALRSGLSLKALQDQVTEVFQEHTKRVKVESIFQGLARETGLTREQLNNIAVTLKGIEA